MPKKKSRGEGNSSNTCQTYYNYLDLLICHNCHGQFLDACMFPCTSLGDSLFPTSQSDIQSQEEESQLRSQSSGGLTEWLSMANQRKFRPDSCWQSGPPTSVSHHLLCEATCPPFSLLSSLWVTFAQILSLRLLLSCPTFFIFLSLSLSFQLHFSARFSSHHVCAVGRKLLWQAGTETEENWPGLLAVRQSPAEPSMSSELFQPLEICHWEHQRLTAISPHFHLAQEMNSNSIQTTFHFIFHKKRYFWRGFFNPLSWF